MHRLGFVDCEWEVPEHAWEDVCPAPADDDPDPDSLSPEEQAEEFVDMLMTLKHRDRLSAKDVCMLSFFASRAGEALTKGKAWDIGKKPGSDHYSRHLDGILLPHGLTEGLEVITAPTYCKYDGSRNETPIHVLPVHRALSDEVAANPSLHAELASVHESGGMPSAYYSSPVVREHGQGVFPVAMFVDGVPFTKRDSVIGFWFYNMLTGNRHLCAVLRKAQQCRCGCRGWCTYFPIFLYISACVMAMGEGRNPLVSEYEKVFADGTRNAAVAGVALAARFMILLLKGDWAEFGPTMCFPTFHPITWATDRALKGCGHQHLHHYENPSSQNENNLFNFFPLPPKRIGATSVSRSLFFLCLLIEELKKLGLGWVCLLIFAKHPKRNATTNLFF